MRRTLPLILTVLLAGAIRSCPADTGGLDPLAKATTLLGPGFLVSLAVFVQGTQEPDLSGEFLLDGHGVLSLSAGKQPVDRIPLRGLTCEQARDVVQARIKKYFVTAPDVRVGIARIPRVQVAVEGSFYRMGTIVLGQGAKLSDLMAAAGYLPSADLHHVDIARADRGSLIRLNADFGALLTGAGPHNDANNPVLQNGDIVHLNDVPVAATAPVGKVAVLGDVKSPGVLPYRQGMTVKEALEQSGGLLPTANPDRVTIRHAGDSIVSISAARALQGVPVDNIRLAPDDTIYVATRDSGQRIAVVGEVADQKTLDDRGTLTLSQAISQAGGFKPDADTGNVIILRGMLQDPAQAHPEAVNYEKIHKGQQPEVILQPGDVVQVSAKKKGKSDILGIGLTLLKLLL